MKTRKKHGAYEFKRLLKIAPYTAKERLRKAIVICHGNLLAVSAVIGYSPWSSQNVKALITRLDLDDEVAEAKRKASTRSSLTGDLTLASKRRRKKAARIVNDARRAEGIERLRAEITELTKH